MTLREYYAGLAMQGLISNPNAQYNWRELALASIETAECLIKELSK